MATTSWRTGCATLPIDTRALAPGERRPGPDEDRKRLDRIGQAQGRACWAVKKEAVAAWTQAGEERAEKKGRVRVGETRPGTCSGLVVLDGALRCAGAAQGDLRAFREIEGIRRTGDGHGGRRRVRLDSRAATSTYQRGLIMMVHEVDLGKPSLASAP